MNPTLARYQVQASIPINRIGVDLERAAETQNSELRQLISEHLRTNGPRVTAPNRHGDSMSEKIPCEFCNRLFSLEAVVVHQIVCDGPSAAATADDDELTAVLNQYEASNQPRTSQPTIKSDSTCHFSCCQKSGSKRCNTKKNASAHIIAKQILGPKKSQKLVSTHNFNFY